MPAEQSPQPSEIARLNDEFRRQGPNGNWFITQGVQVLTDVPGLVHAVRTFDTFTPDNDPYGKHDSGSITWQQEKTFWKIDYYDAALQYGEDPLSEACRRVLTILLVSEY